MSGRALERLPLRSHAERGNELFRRSWVAFPRSHAPAWERRSGRSSVQEPGRALERLQLHSHAERGNELYRRAAGLIPKQELGYDPVRGVVSYTEHLHGYYY